MFIPRPAKKTPAPTLFGESNLFSSSTFGSQPSSSSSGFYSKSFKKKPALAFASKSTPVSTVTEPEPNEIVFSEFDSELVKVANRAVPEPLHQPLQFEKQWNLRLLEKFAANPDLLPNPWPFKGELEEVLRMFFQISMVRSPGRSNFPETELFQYFLVLKQFENPLNVDITSVKSRISKLQQKIQGNLGFHNRRVYDIQLWHLQKHLRPLGIPPPFFLLEYLLLRKKVLQEMNGKDFSIPPFPPLQYPQFPTHFPTVTCDKCGCHGLFGIRFKCLECNDYDLCHSCYLAKAVSKSHKNTHKMRPMGHDLFGTWCVERQEVDLHLNTIMKNQSIKGSETKHLSPKEELEQFAESLDVEFFHSPHLKTAPKKKIEPPAQKGPDLNQVAIKLVLRLKAMGEELGDVSVFAEYIQRLRHPNEKIIYQICSIIGINSLDDLLSKTSTPQDSKQSSASNSPVPSTSSVNEAAEQAEKQLAHKQQIDKLIGRQIILSTLNPDFPTSFRLAHGLDYLDSDSIQEQSTHLNYPSPSKHPPPHPFL